MHAYTFQALQALAMMTLPSPLPMFYLLFLYQMRDSAVAEINRIQGSQIQHTHTNQSAYYSKLCSRPSAPPPLHYRSMRGRGEGRGGMMMEFGSRGAYNSGMRTMGSSSVLRPGDIQRMFPNAGKR